MEFFRDRECKECPLSGGCRSVCIPCRPSNLTEIRLGNNEGKPTRPTAVLVVGEKPATEEDRDDRSFTGITGAYVHQVYLKYCNLEDKVDIYLANAVRCMVPGNGTPTAAQVAHCRSYLLRDIEVLRPFYGRLVVLACGGPACRSATDEPTEGWLSRQGSVSPITGLVTFATRNPAVLLPGRNPSEVVAIEDHMAMLHEYLDTGRVQVELTKVEPVRCLRPDSAAHIVAFDTETYGSLEGLPRQRYFHPKKCMAFDGVQQEHLVKLATLAWRDPKGDLKSSVYVFPEDTWVFSLHLESWIRQRCPEQRFLLGMNLPFDVLMLWHYEPRFRQLVQRKLFQEWGVLPWDLSVSNYLNCDVRPERGLKEISPLLRVADYSEEVSLKKGERYASKWDPRYWRYGALDALATLRCNEVLVGQTRRMYPGTARFTPRSNEWFADSLWTVFEMSDRGIAFDLHKLRATDLRNRRNADTYLRFVRDRWEGSLGGTGCKKYHAAILTAAIEEAGLAGDPRLEVTDKGWTSVNEANINLLLDNLNRKSPTAMQLRALQGYRRVTKIVDTYTGPLLSGQDEEPHNSACVEGIAYPSWYPVPWKDDTTDKAGTKQGRMAAKGPAAQTFPPCIEHCMGSRWPRGVLWGCDYSQMELRILGLVSEEPTILDGYNQNPDFDLHDQTAQMIFGADYKERANAKECRQLGKTINFLIAFGGGAKKLIETVRRDYGLELDLDTAKQYVLRNREGRQRLAQFITENLRRAVRQGYIELPITGHTRLFLGSRKAVEHSYSSEIINFRVQPVAAFYTQGAHREIEDWLRESSWETLVVRNTHDNLTFDSPSPEEFQAVRPEIERRMIGPRYRHELESLVGKSIEIAVATTVYAGPSHV